MYSPHSDKVNMPNRYSDQHTLQKNPSTHLTIRSDNVRSVKFHSDELALLLHQRTL
jgi:hypothetical protein